MRSLFLKIFLWFWLAMTLVIVVLAVSGWTLRSPPRPTATPGTPAATRARQMMSDALALHAQTSIQIYRRGGEQALSRHLRLLENASGIRARLITPDGRWLAPRPSSPELLPEASHVENDIRRLVRRAARRSRSARGQGGPGRNEGRGGWEQTEFAFREEGVLAARPTLAPDGRRYVFVALLSAPPRRDLAKAQMTRRASPFALVLGRRLEPSAQALRLLGVLGTAGVFCFWLVRYLTAPIMQLRAATRQLARGDLSARAGAAVSARRDELGDLGRDFDAMAERLETLMSAQRRLIGDVSHELRSPLARLGIALELARRRAGDEAGEALDRIEREAERLNTLIGQLLMLSRLEGGAAVAKPETLDLAALLREVAEDADYEARSRGCSVRLVQLEECRVAGSRELLRSAVENVVRNAARYTGANSVVEISLCCETEPHEADSASRIGEIPCNSMSSAGYALLCVRDHGSGVPEESLAHLFQPFYRAEDARDRQSGGTGLGLAIAQRAVRLHGGEVKARNAPGGGLQVEIKLPLAAPAACGPERAGAMKSSVTSNSTGG